MESVEVVLAMLLAVVAGGYVGRILPFGVPLPLIQIALGAVVSGVFGHGVELDPDCCSCRRCCSWTAGASPRSGCSATRA
jgi:NhaP-type Na+/H+ or K+/H+ antiporter